jgi:hypothetical protein
MKPYRRRGCLEPIDDGFYFHMRNREYFVYNRNPMWKLPLTFIRSDIAADAFRSLCDAADPATRFLEGTLQVARLQVLVGKSIHRAGFGREGGPAEPCFDPADFDTDFLLRLSGIPGSPVHVGIQGIKDVPGSDLGKDFDSAGTRRISSFSLRDFVQGYTAPAGAFAIWAVRSWVTTSARLIHPQALARWFFTKDRPWNQPWLDYLTPYLSGFRSPVL